MDLSFLEKSIGYFNPEKVKGRCTLIGAGSVGGYVAEALVRSGALQIAIYDDDTVEPHNLGNQVYTTHDLGKKKTEALSERLLSINPDLSLKMYGKYTNDPISGYVFLCVDNIETRKKIAVANKYNMAIKAMFDFRTGGENCEHRAAKWDDMRSIEKFIGSMDFTHDEAVAETEYSACGVALGLVTTVMLVSSIGVSNFITFVRTGQMKECILMDAFKNGGNILAM